MRFDIISSLVLGICFFLVLCVSDVRAGVNVQPFPQPKVFRRGEPWTAEEHGRLMKLRGQRKSWNEIAKSFPGRSWTALATRYYNFTRDPSITQEERKRWAKKEVELLLELVKTDLSYEEIAKKNFQDERRTQ